jgi:hypothetical protein
MEEALDLVTNTLSYLISLLFDKLVQGTFQIAGRYCEPENSVPARGNTLQFLLHGATYDRNYVSQYQKKNPFSQVYTPRASFRPPFPPETPQEAQLTLRSGQPMAPQNPAITTPTAG